MTRQAYIDTLDALGDAWLRNAFITPSFGWWLYVRDTVVTFAPHLQGAFGRSDR